MEKDLHARHIREKTGLSRASVARLASKGVIPDAYRHDGVHFRFKDTAKLQRWILEFAAKKQVPQLPMGRNFHLPYFVTLENVKTLFDLWKHNATESGFPHKWPSWRLKETEKTLKEMASTLREVNGVLLVRGDA